MAFHKGLMSATVLTSLPLCLSSHATAQTSATNPVDPTEIIVTARRQEENIQTVPVSVTALSGESLREASIQRPADLMIATPGVYLRGAGSEMATHYAIRGQSRATVGVGQPAVVSYFAEVPDLTLGSVAPTYDLGSVQILKGPQGTLFGRNTTGGAILYYPVAPSYRLDGYLQLSGGNYKYREVEGAINVPLVEDKVALRLATQIRRRDGFTRNIGVGPDFDNQHSDSVRGSLLLDPTPWLTSTTIVDYYRSKGASNASVLVDVGPGIVDLVGLGAPFQAALATQQARGIRQVDSDIAPFLYIKKIGITNNSKIDLSDDISLTNIFGYRSTEINYVTNSDGVGVLSADGAAPFVPAGTPFVFLNGYQKSDLRQLSDELQLRGTVFDEKLDWLVGGFWLDSRPTGPVGVKLDILTIPGFTGGTFAYQFYTEKSHALYGNANYDLSDVVEGLKFSAGLRHTWDKYQSCTASSASFNGPFSVEPGDCDASNLSLTNVSDVSGKSSGVSWSVGFDWQARPDLFLYVVNRHGYRAGGINSPSFGGTLLPYQSFKPEQVTDYEAGVKSEFSFGTVRTRLNLAAFIGFYKNALSSASGLTTNAGCIAGDPVFGTFPYTPDGNCNPSDDPSATTLLSNFGKTKVPGIEGSFTIWPVSHLSLSASGSYLDPKTRKFAAPPALAPYVTANKFPFDYTPRKSFSLAARYEIALPDVLGKLVLNGDYYWSGKIPMSGYIAPSYDLVNARIDVTDIAGRPLDIGFFMRNVFNAKYQATNTLPGATLGVSSVTYGDPRTYGVQLRYRFGQ